MSTTKKLARCLTLLTLVLLTTSQNSYAQNDRAFPRSDYFRGFGAYSEGEFRTAGTIFKRAANGGRRSVNGRWVDSICYHAMMGECLYQMGENDLALEQFNSAVNLYIRNNGWLLRVEFPADIRPATRTVRPPISWGASTRRTIIGNIPDRMQSREGRLNNNDVIRQGGVVLPPQLLQLHVGEVLRCMAVAMRRRAQILGPLAEHDQLSDTLLEAIATRQAPQGHWMQSWLDCLMGLAYLGDNKPVQAASELQKSLQIAGRYDHQMTGIALLELGKIAFHQGNNQQAATLFFEATHAAAHFEQYDIMADAFRWGYVTHVVSGQPGVYPPLANASGWARRNSRFLHATLNILAAENFAYVDDTRRARAVLNDAGTSFGRREMKTGRVGADFMFTSALVSFQQGKVSDGMSSLNSAMKFQREGSLWLYRIGLADNLYRAGTITPRVAGLMYDNLLREPVAKDWGTQPMETIAYLTTPHTLPMEHWFELTLQQKEHEKAIEIADRVRRHRFHVTQPMGGRLLGLRWVLNAPADALSDEAKLQRQNMMVKFVKYNQLSQQVEANRAVLAQIPLAPQEADAIQRQTDTFKELAQTSSAQELLLRQFALQRVPSEISFPPLRDIKKMQGDLPEGTYVLSFFSTTRALYGFVIGRTTYAGWKVESPAKLRIKIVSLLRTMGNYGDVSELSGKELRDPSWKDAAAELMAEMIPNLEGQQWSAIKELVIVPDGILWYVPFETLPIGEGDNIASMLSKFPIRYAPTVSLALPDGRGFKPNARTAVVVDRLFPKDDIAVAEDAFTQLQEVLPGCERVPEKLQLPSALVSSQADRLITYADIPAPRGGPFAWPPFADRGSVSGHLLAWQSLPFASPQQVLLPGFHTPAESALKGKATGDDVFLSVCGLMSTGTRTILMSRWRVGGQTSFDLMREFAQELPHRAAATAWQRSVDLSTISELQPDREPRVSELGTGSEVTAEHPFFWSGYVLIDTGAKPRQE